MKQEQNDKVYVNELWYPAIVFWDQETFFNKVEWVYNVRKSHFKEQSYTEKIMKFKDIEIWDIFIENKFMNSDNTISLDCTMKIWKDLRLAIHWDGSSHFTYKENEWDQFLEHSVCIFNN